MPILADPAIVPAAAAFGEGQPALRRIELASAVGLR